ncbi:hypothetical protein HDU87_008088 [Geranomyces variabilis]|uniref:Uncharacterized protein n=1 Tax=Geranomyces variabilis TaxID=109894 RepID=A0AAD5XPQ8_9FUNG|nr:hypothetical protein HDU87_008088 [Geranomyces variabilis]
MSAHHSQPPPAEHIATAPDPLVRDAVEAHGIVQFTASQTKSDNRDDDWLIAAMADAEAAAEEPAPVKAPRHFIDRDYVMRATYDGCFHAPSLDAIPSIFALKQGPNSLVSSMEHLYVAGDYAGTLAVAEAWRATNATSKKKFKETEVLEITARCMLRLGEPAHAATFLDAHRSASTDAGWLLLLAETYSRCEGRERVADALQALQAYDISRPVDPTTYRLLARVFEKSGYMSRAARCLRTAIELYGRNAPDAPIARIHALAEVKRLEDLAVRLEAVPAARTTAPDPSLEALPEPWAWLDRAAGGEPMDQGADDKLSKDE